MTTTDYTALVDKLESRLRNKIDVTDECWNWLAHLNPKGYGRFYYCGGFKQAHRVTYELLKGPIPPGLTLDHLCRNRACVNPAHLEPVNNRENVMRGVSVAARNARKTHCPQGHEYSPENTYIEKPRAGRVQTRKCRICSQAHSFRWYREHAALDTGEKP